MAPAFGSSPASVQWNAGGYPSAAGKGIKSDRSQWPPSRGKSTRGVGSLGNGKGPRRHRKVVKDNINSITKGDIRRLARRGGVKRISGGIYITTREALKKRVEEIMKICTAICDYRDKKTITVSDVIYALRRLGNPMYGFDPDTQNTTAGKK